MNPHRRVERNFCHPDRGLSSALLLGLLLPLLAHADGGIVRARQSQGAFIVTVFSPADITSSQPTDFSFLVQRRGSGEVVMDATVDVALTPPLNAHIRPGDPFCSPLIPGSAYLLAGGPAPAAVFPATRSHAANKLLYGLSMILHAPGTWQLHADIREGDRAANLDCALPVGAPRARLGILWPCLALPPLAILLFILNQWLRRPLTQGVPNRARASSVSSA